MFCWSDHSPAGLRDISNSIDIVPLLYLDVFLTIGFSRNRHVQQGTGMGPSALSRWISPGLWQRAPLLGVSIPCCLGV